MLDEARGEINLAACIQSCPLRVESGGEGQPPWRPGAVPATASARAVEARTNPSVRAHREAADEKALAFYESVVDDESQPTHLRLIAGEKLLDRLFGKPLAASVNINRDDLSLLTDD